MRLLSFFLGANSPKQVKAVPNINLHMIWKSILEFMAGIDGTEYRNSIPETPTARAYWERHLRNDQTAFNEFEERRYAAGISSVKVQERVK